MFLINIMDIKGTTISFREIPNFDRLSLKEATDIIYNELIPACESKHVLLSQMGNNNDKGLDGSYIEKYQEDKATRKLFDVKRIQKAFSSIPVMLQRVTQYQRGSYGLKHDVEKHPCQKEYITNGDLIVAMLFRGYKARFGKITEPMKVNCEFQVKLKKLPQLIR